MKNLKLAADYLTRAEGRLKALDTLFNESLWADVVRESQEVVELALRGLLRSLHIDVPRVHDVGGVLEAHKEKLPDVILESLPAILDISHELRRDRELAFYGSEDITPLDFYKKKHAVEAKESALKIVTLCQKAMR